MALFTEPPVWVAGSASLVRRVVAALAHRRRRALALDLADLSGLEPGACRTLVLADPPDPAELIAGLAKLPALQGRRGIPSRPLRLILMHPADPPPTLPELAPGGPIAVETFALEDRAARALCARWSLHSGLDPVYGQVPHLLVRGLETPPGRALLVQALRLMAYGESRPRVTVAGASPQTRAGFQAAYPQAPQVADFAWVDADLAGLEPVPPVTQVFVCAGPETGADVLEPAHAVGRRIAAIQGVSPPILLEVGDRVADGTLADWDGQVFPFSYLETACRPEVLFDGLGDELARSIHEQYTDSIAAQGRDPEREPAGRPWSGLAASYRNANRHQADHLWAKLAVMDCRAVPEERVESFTFAPLEAEHLAVIEHLRWAADRHLDGWSYAPVRDNARRHHPQLIPYPDLSEPMKDLDRFAVRGVPSLLARSGLGVVRMLILGIPDAAGCPADRRLAQLARDVLERLLARYPDRSLVLAATLTDPAARLVARLALDLAGAALFLLCARPLTQTLADVPDDPARLELLGLAARAERRISLPGPGEPTRWLETRTAIQICLGAGAGDAGRTDRRGAPGRQRRVWIDPEAGFVEWGFEY